MRKAWMGIAALLLGTSGAMAQTIDTESGVVRGSSADGVESWKGIPYAQPPVGKLRWRAPQPMPAWKGVRDAMQYGNDCMQTPFAGDAAPLGSALSEDCLTLNLWRPAGATAGAKLPVLVWIHGGGLVNGAASPAVFDGSSFARRGVILLSMNYRLGRFGFFAHPALTAANEDNGLLGNYGYLDQLAALRWLRRNIAAFGGDPRNVTIMGESAGGGSVNVMMTSPMARGLFQAAIVMSGGGRNPRATLPVHATSADDGEDLGLGFAKWAGVTGEGAEALAALRALPAEKLAEGVSMARQPVAPLSGPMIDGKLIVRDVDKVYRSGKAAPVPFIAGATSADIGYGPKVEGEVFNYFGPDAEKARQAYSGAVAKAWQMRQAVFADAVMVEPARFTVQQMAKAGQPSWQYRAAYVPQAMREMWVTGLPHANEVPFFFGTVATRYGDEATAGDMKMGELMNAYFANFAKSHDPNGAGLPKWPRYDDRSRPIMVFGNEGAKGGADPWRARLDLHQARAEREAASAKP